MKKLNIFVGIFAVLTVLLACSGDSENLQQTSSPDKSILSFGAVLNDLASLKEALKQEIGEIPDCSEDVPAFLEVVISRNDIEVVGSMEKPFKIKINPNAVDSNGDGMVEYISQKAAEVELEPGNYTLEHFTVLNSLGEVIWIAPVVIEGNQFFASIMDRPLPYRFSLAPGLKKYLDIQVFCFNNRFVLNADPLEAMEFCIFGNYCNEDDRHADAMGIIASIWKYSGNEEEPRGTLLYENVKNGIVVTDYFEEGYSETTADPICVSLPGTAENDEFYIEITLGSGVGYTAEEKLIRKGIINEEDIKLLYDGADRLDYYHIREGNCNLADSPELLNVIVSEDAN
ncbi:hypothetical protein LZ575_00805 [Antarcticibacterium sp. 1MA-6-2]|uniref:hypothetical protein n=1 Tax=Antarcticibacterium sp. 1MA-6-2 TaxID=2908210 RepID=UPI001F3A8546|nr:hypothetical protein [Antarcticibacterium sp. 1MA-6-2]UJH91366.1 hypothetical protein LZ575_00805 [Antarcticibacterium sp. 1MA-6-2]